MPTRSWPADAGAARAHPERSDRQSGHQRPGPRRADRLQGRSAGQPRDGRQGGPGRPRNGVSTLSISYPEAQWKLASPAHVRFGEVLAVERLNLTAGPQAIAVDVRKDGQRVKGQVRVTAVDLSRLPHWAIAHELGLQGQLGADVRLDGRLPRTGHHRAGRPDRRRVPALPRPHAGGGCSVHPGARQGDARRRDEGAPPEGHLRCAGAGAAPRTPPGGGRGRGVPHPGAGRADLLPQAHPRGAQPAPLPG